MDSLRSLPGPRVLAGLTALLLMALLAQGLGALAWPSGPEVLAQWGTVAIPVTGVLLFLAWWRRTDPVWGCPLVPLAASRLRHERTVWLMVLVGWLVYFALAAQRHRAYQTNAFDLGIWHQIIWNSGHGAPFLVSLESWEDETLLAWHFTLTAMLFGPLTWFTDSPLSILAAQSFLLCLGAVPVYRFARKRLGDGALSHVVAAAYLMSPILRGANAYEFHEIALSIPCLAFALYWVDERAYGKAILPVVLGCLTKESTALALSGIGIAYALERGVSWKKRLGMAAFTLAMLTWFFLCMTVITPAMGELSQSFFYLFRYENLGNSVGEIVRNLVTHPWRFLSVPFESGDKWLYFLRTVGPFAFLPLLAPRFLMAAAPTYMMNTLGVYKAMHTVHYHYGAEMAPALAMASAHGAAWLLQHWPNRWELPQRRRAVGYALLAASLALYGPSELARARRMPRTEQHEAMDRFLEQVPRDAVVSCQTIYCPHLSARRYLYLYPRIMGHRDEPLGTLTRLSHPEEKARRIQAQYIVLDTALDQPKYWQSKEWFARSLNDLPGDGYRLKSQLGTLRLYELVEPGKCVRAALPTPETPCP